jgi:ATP-dependent Lon protease
MDEVPKELMGEIQFIFVENVRQVFDIALKERATTPASVPPRPKALPQPAPPTAH